MYAVITKWTMIEWTIVKINKTINHLWFPIGFQNDAFSATAAKYSNNYLRFGRWKHTQIIS